MSIHCRGRIATREGIVFLAGREVDAEMIEACQHDCRTADIEQLFTIEGRHAADEFRDDLIRLLQTIPSLAEIYDVAAHKFWLDQGLNLFEMYEAIGFRMRILKACLPFEYNRTLFCIWLIVFESEGSKRESSDFESLFLCGLSHDLGLLDIDSKFTRLDHDPRSTKDDVDGYYSHASYSSTFLKQFSGISPKVIKSIQQHHENMDGTGFPDGKSGNQLAEYGQHIHLFDTLYSIYVKNYQPLGKSLADLIPVIEINAVTHFGQVAVRMVSVLEKSSRTQNVFFKRDDFYKIQSETEEMSAYIEQSMGVIQAFTESVGFRHEDRILFVLQNSFIHIALSYYKLRILHKQAMLSDVLAEEGDYEQVAKALEDNFLSLREIIFHINKFLYRLRQYRAQQTEGTVADQAERSIEALSKLNLKLVH